MTETLNKLDGTQQEQAQTVLLLEELGNELTDIMNVLEMNTI